MIKQDQEDSETKVDSPRQSQTPQDSLYQLLCPLPANEGTALNQKDSKTRVAFRAILCIVQLALECKREHTLYCALYFAGTNLELWGGGGGTLL